uniref:Uncharacterized protein n=1 Tax=Oryza meridionalis TaxID=40149 RepID=A0A0E0E3Y8_9ORYZ
MLLLPPLTSSLLWIDGARKGSNCGAGRKVAAARGTAAATVSQRLRMAAHTTASLSPSLVPSSHPPAGTPTLLSGDGGGVEPPSEPVDAAITAGAKADAAEEQQPPLVGDGYGEGLLFGGAEELDAGCRGAVHWRCWFFVSSDLLRWRCSFKNDHWREPVEEVNEAVDENNGERDTAGVATGSTDSGAGSGDGTLQTQKWCSTATIALRVVAEAAMLFDGNDVDDDDDGRQQFPTGDGCQIECSCAQNRVLAARRDFGRRQKVSSVAMLAATGWVGSNILLVS